MIVTNYSNSWAPVESQIEHNRLEFQIQLLW